MLTLGFSALLGVDSGRDEDRQMGLRVKLESLVDVPVEMNCQIGNDADGAGEIESRDSILRPPVGRLRSTLPARASGLSIQVDSMGEPYTSTAARSRPLPERVFLCAP